MEITLNLPELLTQQIVESLLQESGNSLDDAINPSVGSLGDEDVKALTMMMAGGEYDRRFSYLLGLNRESEITPEQEKEMDGLLEIYQRLLVYKSNALVEAVHRGLIPPLSEWNPHE